MSQGIVFPCCLEPFATDVYLLLFLNRAMEIQLIMQPLKSKREHMSV